MHLSGDCWTHGPHGAFCAAVSGGQLTSDGHVTGNAGHKDDAATLGAVLNHLFCSKLSRMIDTHNVHADQLLVLLKRSLQEAQVAIDTCTRHTYVKLGPEICLERCKSFFQAFFAADIDSKIIEISYRPRP